mgnify:CR=1 FL=1
MRRFDFVLFDADNTLFDYDRAEGFALESLLKERGVELGPDVHDTYRRINAEYWRRYEQGEVTQDELRVGRFAEFAKAVGVEADAAGLSERYLEFLASAGFLIQGAEQIVAALAEAEVTLGLITNGIEEVQRGRLSRSPLADAFVSVTISGEVGSKKPDRRIFEIAFQRSGNPEKDRSIIVGDSLSSDIAGGHNFGIATCWFNPSGARIREDLVSSGRTPDYVVSDLGELREVVGLT